MLLLDDTETPYTIFSYDWVEVHDGPSAEAPMIGSRMCGNGTLDGTLVHATGHEAHVRFHSDSSVSGSGFVIQVEARGI